MTDYDRNKEPLKDWYAPDLEIRGKNKNSYSPTAISTTDTTLVSARVEAKLESFSQKKTDTEPVSEILYRIVIKISLVSGEKCVGMSGEISSNWVEDLEEASKQIKMLRSITVLTPTLNIIEFDDIINRAIDDFCSEISYREW